MSFYRREIRVGNSLLLKKKGSGSWIRIDVLSLDGTHVQVGVDAPVDYPSKADRKNLVIGPIRVFVLKRIGTQKIQFGVKAPRRFSVVRSNGGTADSKQFDGQRKNTGTNARVLNEVDTLAERDSAHEGSGPLVQENPAQRHDKSSETAPLVFGPAINLEMQRLLSRNHQRLR